MKEVPRSRISTRQSSIRQSEWLADGLFPSTSFPIRSLFDALGNWPIGVAVYNRQLRFVAVNKKLAEINSIPLDEHPGRPIHEIIGGLAPTVVARLEQVFRTGRPLYNADLIGHLGKNPIPGHWLENYFPILDDLRRVMYVGAFILPLCGIELRLDMNRNLSGRAALTDYQALSPVTTTQQPTTSTAGIVSNGARSGYPRLSLRELEILRLLAEGETIKEAASRLAISVKTVETYRSRLMQKLQANSTVHLVHYAIRHRVVNLL